jgi:hypothetical protein
MVWVVVWLGWGQREEGGEVTEGKWCRRSATSAAREVEEVTEEVDKVGERWGVGVRESKGGEEGGKETRPRSKSIVAFECCRKSAPKMGCEMLACKKKCTKELPLNWRGRRTNCQEGILPPFALTINGPEGGSSER